jgi:hypothetical protein
MSEGVPERIAFCGLDCEKCPALLATRQDDLRALEKVAEGWSKESGRAISADDIRCDGCKQPDGRMNTFCEVCRIRACAIQKGYPDCAHCDEYPCGPLVGFPHFESERKANLERIRKDLLSPPVG